MYSRWRNAASLAIAEALGRFTEGGGDLFDLNETDHKTIKALIRNSYPFDVRTNHPYKMWCDEQRKVLVSLGIPVPESDHALSIDPNQLNLFSTRSKNPRTQQNG